MVSPESPNRQASDPARWPIGILRIGACACFAGWAWQHLRWSVPYGTLLWHPDYFGWLARALDVSWETYVADVVTDDRILLGVRMVGVIYLALAILALTATRDSLLQLACLCFGSLALAAVALSKFVDASHAMATLVEHGGQVLTPTVLVLALRRGVADRWTIAVALVAFWTTFAGHGVYALGLAPTPGRFYGLVHAILGAGPELCETLLRTAGILDFLVCLGVLVPVLRAGCLAYATLWGLLTALARPVAGMSVQSAWFGADQFLHEAILRAPHACVPLFLLLVFTARQHHAPKRFFLPQMKHGSNTDIHRRRPVFLLCQSVFHRWLIHRAI